MPSLALVRLGGLAAVGAGVLFVLGDLLTLIYIGSGEPFSGTATRGSFVTQQVLYLLANALLLGGLVGLYVRQSEAAGVLGLAGFLVAFFGTVLDAGAAWTGLFVTPTVAEEAPEFLDEESGGALGFGFLLTYSLFALGWLLFGVASLRAWVYPRRAAILLIVGAVITFLPLPFTAIVLGVAVAWLGYDLLSGRGEAAQRPSRVS